MARLVAEDDRPTRPARIVIDASVVLAWLLPDESSEVADSIIRTASADQLVAPSLILLEVSNALVQANRRQRIETSDIEKLLQQFSGLPLRLEPVSSDVMLRASMIAARQAVTVYDGCYVDAATLRKLPLATFDQRMARAAAEEGVTLVA